MKWISRRLDSLIVVVWRLWSGAFISVYIHKQINMNTVTYIHNYRCARIIYNKNNNKLCYLIGMQVYFFLFFHIYSAMAATSAAHTLSTNASGTETAATMGAVLSF